MEKIKTKFIVNPFSGTSRKTKLSDLLKTHLDQSKYDYEILHTAYPEHARDIALECVEKKYGLVVAVGGDGTVNEVAGALVNSDTVFGIIPGGSGNGFYLHLGIGRKVINAINVLNTGKIMEIDTCKVNDHFFLNVAGLGFDARIAYLTKSSKIRGLLAYLMTTLKEAKSFRPSQLSISVDGEVHEGIFTAAVVANASMYGYYFTVAPMAKLNDGVLDLILIKDAPKYKYFINSYRFLNRSLHKSHLTIALRGKSITMKAYEPVHIHVDGEGMEADTEFKFEITPLSLKVLVPPQFN